MEKDEFEMGRSLACRFLSYRPRSRKEIENKMREKKMSEETIEKVIKYLEENNYINDKEFAMNWIQYRLENRPRGRIFLEYELREKGIPHDLIEESLDKVYKDEFNEYDIATKLAERKLMSFRSHTIRGNQMENHILKKRLFNYLLRKGFSYDIIDRVVFTLLEDEPTE